MNFQWRREHFPKKSRLWYLHEDENNEDFLQKTCWNSRVQCIDDIDESMRIRFNRNIITISWGSHRYKRHIFTESFFLGAQVFRFPQVSKIPDTKTAVKKYGEYFRKYLYVCCRKSETKKRGSMKERIKVHFYVIDGSLSSQEFGDGASISKVQRLSRMPRWHCPRWFRIIRCIYWTKIIRITDDSRKSHGHYIKTSGIRPTSSWYSIHLSQIKMEDSSMLLKIPKSDCTGSWILLSKHKWSKSWFSMKDLTFYEDEIKFIDKKQNNNPTWIILMKDFDLRKSISFLDHVYLDCTRRGYLISKDIMDNSKSMFESKISVGTINIFQKQESQGNQTLISSLHDSILWKSMQRSTCKDSISWGGGGGGKNKKHNVIITQSLMITNFDEEIGSDGELSTGFLTKWFEMSILRVTCIDSPDILWSVIKENWQKLVTNVWRVWSLHSSLIRIQIMLL